MERSQRRGRQKDGREVLNENSKLLFISTEGDTDRKNYRSIVWDGKYDSYQKQPLC